MPPTPSNPSYQPAQPGDLATFVNLIKAVRVAMLTTFPASSASPSHAHAHTQMHTRPMYTQKVAPPDADSPNRFTGELWFMTDDQSPKVREIQDDEHVLITYADQGQNTYVVVKGRASVERNPAKAQDLWNIHAKGWWPGGPDDPRLVLLRVAVDSAEYWHGPSNTSYMLNLLKAVVTGSRVRIQSEHGKIGI